MFLQKKKSPRFWAALAGAALILLQAFGVKIPAPVVNEVIAAISALMVLFGFVELPKNGDEEDNTSDKTDPPADDQNKDNSPK
ncbi:MAG: hypothetical protein FWH03_01190 [Firmicutes bacterium]|nr:hypothetical protein [Bacillota bacterium]